MYIFRVTGKPPQPTLAERADGEKRAGIQLRELRKARGWPLREVARRMESYGYHWHQTVVAKIETGQRPLRLNEALDLAALFGVSVTDLLVPPMGRDEARAEAEALQVALKDAEEKSKAAQQEAATAAQDSAAAQAAVESIRSRLMLLQPLLEDPEEAQR
jgi:transcriptional regulator with XRE-family HTH domain